MKRELTWILAAKIIALGLLWLLFFSGAHRLSVDPAAAGEHLGVAPLPADSEPDPRSRPQERTDD